MVVVARRKGDVLVLGVALGGTALALGAALAWGASLALTLGGALALGPALALGVASRLKGGLVLASLTHIGGGAQGGYSPFTRGNCHLSPGTYVN